MNGRDATMKKRIAIIASLLFFILLIPILWMITLSSEHNYEIVLSSDEIEKISIVEIENNGITFLRDFSDDSDISSILGELCDLKCSKLVPPSYAFNGKGLLITYSDNRYELILDKVNSYYKGGADQWNGETHDYRTESFSGTAFYELVDKYLSK